MNATDALELWFDNDYGLYTLKREWLRQQEGPIGQHDAREFVLVDVTGDFYDGLNEELPRFRLLHSVNWTEVAADWEDERLEMLAYEAEEV
jgi:hypothetical protein